MDIFKNILKSVNTGEMSILADGESSAESTGTVDTGSYVLNALLSGSIFGGASNNRILGFAGEEATGKTFFVLGLANQFLKDNPTGAVFYFDTESAIAKATAESRGVDTSRVIIVESDTVQMFRQKALQILTKYAETDESERPPMMFILDSLGQLSTLKELEDSEAGNDTRDMTRAQLLKAAFRTLNLKLAQSKVPMYVTNHVYDVVGSYIPTKDMSGGSGLKYAASQILFLSKSKDRDKDRNVIGNIIKVRLQKSRMTKENSLVQVKLSYETGLDRYYGLIDLAVAGGVFTKSTKTVTTPNGSGTENEIYKEPEKYFTKDVLEQIDAYAKKVFLYGKGEDSTPVVLVEDDSPVVKPKKKQYGKKAA